MYLIHNTYSISCKPKNNKLLVTKLSKTSKALVFNGKEKKKVKESAENKVNVCHRKLSGECDDLEVVSLIY
jgi:hypothetical protein